MDQFAARGRFSSREEEADEEQEDASNSNSMREISFMPASAAGTTTASSSAAASASASASTSAASASAASGSNSAAATAHFRSASGDAAGASGSGAAAEVEAVEKEHMFDKVVTPSDVGKLNRLVIPKQYAEKYFPLDSAAGSEKGLLLAFEDGAGKHWRFRYSYWNSSQSYVMTKGWSRFVKEKRLVAGDTVSFSRAAAEDSRHRLFIDWKRRVDARGPLRFSGLALPMPLGSHYGVGVGPHHYGYSPAAWGFGGGFGGGGGAAGGSFFMPPSPPATLYEHRLRQGLDFRSMTTSTTYPASTVGRQLLFFGSAARTMPPHQHQHQHHAPPLHPQPPRPLSLPLHHFTVHQPSAAASSRPVVLDSVPVIESPTTAAKRVRLFGVNLDNKNNPMSESSDGGGGGGGGGGASHHQQGNALSLQMPGWQQRTNPTLRLLELPPRHGAESSAASSPSSSSSSKREARSALDLDL